MGNLEPARGILILDDSGSQLPFLIVFDESASGVPRFKYPSCMLYLKMSFERKEKTKTTIKCFYSNFFFL